MYASVTVPGLPSSAPLWLTLMALFVVVLLRSHATYWLARLVSRGATNAVLHDEHHWSHRVRVWLQAPATQRAVTTIGKWGAPAVTFAYLTVGFQSAIMVAAGLIQMPYGRFALASIPGCVAWAVIWGTIGLSVFWAGVALAARSPWALAAAIALIGGVVVWWLIRRARG